MNFIIDKSNLLTLFVLFIVLLNSCTTIEPEVELYEVYQLNGFEVKVEKKAFEIDSLLTQKAIDRLDEDLLIITNLELNSEILASLQTVTIFLDWNTSNRLAVYHPSLDWLVDNGYSEEKYKSVEVTKISQYLEKTALNQPYIILHELAHAYHHQVLGPSNAAISEAYDNAISQGLYRDVTFDNGFEILPAPFAYAYTDEREYFAELTEAYFGWNSYFPFVKSELETYDPVGFDLIETAWEQN